MNTILVATDFSQPSRDAALYAAHLAKANNAELVLLHVYMLPTPVSEVPYVMVSVDEIQQENEKQTNSIAASLTEATGVTVRSLVTIGMVADEVFYQAKEAAADLVVTGMKGENTAIDKLIGSTTAAIIRKSAVPVLVIPAGSVYKTTAAIIYATDFSYSMNLGCLQLLQEWVGIQKGTSLLVVNVQKPGEILSADQISAKLSLENRLESINHSFHTEIHASVEDGLDHFLQSHPSQLLVMVAHRHSWWNRLLNGSHTREMVYRADIPLLVLQDKP